MAQVYHQVEPNHQPRCGHSLGALCRIEDPLWFFLCWR